MLPNFKFLIVLILFSTLYFLFSPIPSFAQSATPAATTNLATPTTNSDVPNTLHNWTQTVMIEVMSSLTCQLAGVDPINPKQGCLGIDSASGKIGFLPSPQTGGAIGFMGNMIATLYTPPLHTSDYFQDLASNFGINKQAYAQNTEGTGFKGLTPLIGIWTAFRNIVYLFLVIVFVVIGLAIMLRVKIDPRTVMTIQNQIPKIIIGILVVTFSFAIAGFLIDLMWVFIYLIYGIFTGIPGVDVGNLNPVTIQGQNALRVAGHTSTAGIFGITHTAASSAKDALQGILNIKAGPLEIFNPFALLVDLTDPTKRGSVANWFIDLLSTGAGGATLYYFLNASEKIASAVTNFPVIGGIPILNIIPKTIGGAIQNGGILSSIAFGEAAFAGTESLLRNWLPYLIAYLIIFIALLTALFRLWFTLIIAYVQILLAVVLAPFWIIGGIVPGSPISFSGWVRNISANLLAFPVTIAMFMLGKVFMDAFGCDPKIQTCKDALTHNFVPPLIGNHGDPSAIGSLIGLGIILMTPNVVNMLKSALKAPKLDTGLGKALSPGLAVPGRTIGGVAGLALGTAYERGALEKGLPFGERNPLGKFLRGFGFIR